MLPFIQFAIVDATLGAALPILTMIPLNMVKQGSKLEQFVIMTTKLGVPYPNSTTIRIINGSSIQRAERLFANLTKDAVNVYNPSTGVTVANMGNGNVITYRTISASGYPATIEYNFTQLLGTNSFKLKFAP